MVRTMENPTTLYNNNISCNPRNNDIGWITGQITLIWNELYSAWKLRNSNAKSGWTKSRDREGSYNIYNLSAT
jgi:hypothetical protein